MLNQILKAFAFAYAKLTGTATIVDCGNSASLFTINSVTLDPTTAVAGQDFTVHMEYTVPDGPVIEDGRATFDFSLNGLPFSPTTEPLCAQLPCPVMPGSYINNTLSTWPDVSGKIIVTNKWLDTADKLLLCFQITAKY